MISVLQLGDCHFDDAYYLNKPERRRLLEDSRVVALKTAVETAVEHQVDLFVWAGDILDGERRVSLKTRGLLEQALFELKHEEIEIVWMTGNHDPGEYIKMQGIDDLLMENGVHLFDGQVREIQLTARNGEPYRVVGSGHEIKGLTENRIRTYPVKMDSVTTIGLLHGSVQGAVGLDGEALYFPCTKADLARLGYDLICLGHVHVPGRIEGAGQHAFYAGSLTGLSAKETGPRGVWLHQVGQGALKSRFLNVAPLEWKTVRLTLVPELTMDQITDQIKLGLEAQTGASELVAYQEEDSFNFITRRMIRLSVSGTHDGFLMALRHDSDMLRERLSTALGGADLEIRAALIPEHLVELRRTGDSFAAYLNACLEDAGFMNRIWMRYAERALPLESLSEEEVAQDEFDESVQFGDEAIFGDEKRLRDALVDLWPRWIGGGSA